MKIKDVIIETPLFLAPMAGVPDLAFRKICRELGVGATVTEMVSSRALVYQDKKSNQILRINEGLDCGSVRLPLAELIEADLPIAQECAKMIREAVAKYC